MSFSFEPCLRKLEKQEKEGNDGLERDCGVTQRKLRKTPHSKKTQVNRGTEKKLKMQVI